MATKPYSYHQQVARLARALELIRQAQDEIAACADHERDHSQEEGAQEYEDLLVNVERARDVVNTFKDAVAALAAHQPPDLVEPHDPTDYSTDERFQQMIDSTFDVALGHGMEPDEVIRALSAAVAEGDQR